MRYLGFILVLLVGLSSCDSREDWFEHNSEFPDLIVDINGKTDTIRQGDLRKIVVNLSSMSFDKASIFFTDTVNMTLKGIKDNRIFPLDGTNFDIRIHGSNYNIGDNKEVMIQLYDYYPYRLPSFYKADELYVADSVAHLLTTENGHMYAFDEFGNKQVYTIEVNIFGPIPPYPVLQIEKISGDLEYKLSLEDSKDKDGNVVKYEWCIDGEIVPYDVKDYRLDHIEGNWQSGKAAYGGTYITATALSSVNHSFQTAGEHTVYYRCMDNMGIWSMWYSKKINVE